MRTLGKSLVPCLVVGLAASCVSVNNLYSSLVGRKAGMGGVERLLSYVEHVHVDTRLSQERAGASLDALHEMVSRDFSGDPLLAYARFVESIDATEIQSKVLAESIENMKISADVVFEAWATDLEKYNSTEMRLRSHERMDKSKMSYRAIVLKVEQVHKQLDEYVASLRDHAYFLSHDFNAAAVASLEPDLRRLGLQASDLAKKQQAAMDSLDEYIRLTSLPGAVGTPEDRAVSDGSQPAVDSERIGGVPPLR